MNKEPELSVSMIDHKCPVCGSKSYIELNQTMPQITATYSESDVEEAKRQVLARLEALVLKPVEKAQYREWVMRNDVVFGLEDIEAVLKTFVRGEE